MYGGSPPTHLMWSSMFRPDKPKVEKPVQWKRLGALFLPYWKQEVAVLICIGCTSVLGLVPPLLTMKLIDKAIPSSDTQLLYLCVGGMVVAALISAIIGFGQGYLNAYVAEGILRDLRTQLYSHMNHMPLSFFTSTKTGEIMNRVSNDVDNVDDVISGTLVTIATNILTLLTTLVTIFALDWRLALLAVALLPLMIYPLWPVGRKMYEIRKATRKKRDHISSLNQETLSISGTTLVKSFVRELYEKARFHEAATDLMDSEIKLAMIGRWFMALITGMVIVGPAIVWLGGGWMAIHKMITVGAVVTFVALLARLYTPASSLAGIQVQVVGALAVFERIFEYLDMEEEGRSDNEKAVLGTVVGAVRFEQVSFFYSQERPLLHEIDLNIEPGQMAALVGPSGGGKTTITHLLERFYEPCAGRILIDGADISTITLQSLRNHIGIVTQETYLFHDTIANNLKYGKLDATVEEMEQAARAANIHDFIAQLPEAYETIVGERGHKLSGGERQRLAIARVLLKDPRILILDEATSSLDSVNEALIQAALVPLMQGRTSLVIAHRLSTILSADVIFVVESGRVVERGKHEELLAAGQSYSRLYKEQFRDGSSAGAELGTSSRLPMPPSGTVIPSLESWPGRERS
jgi:ATP-binding cassette, subfamily B, bacterial